MNRIKVAHIVPMLGPGGAERVALHIVSGMNRQRYEPMMISLMGRTGCDLDRQLDEAEVEVLYLGKHLGFDHRMYSRVYRVLRDCHPDIVHTHLQVLRYVFPCLTLLRGLSALHTVHNLADREIEYGMRWLQKFALNHGVVPVAVAEEVAASLKRSYGIPECCVIPNGIPTGLYAHPKTPRNEWRAREGFGETDVLFVCVARFAPQKNHSLLLDAFAKGPAADRNAHLMLVGEGPLRGQLEARAEGLGVASRVHFLGVRTDIPNVLGAMDVFVLSSDWEGNPLSVMEAMASGLPIVSTAVGSVPDLFANGREGFLVPRGDVAGLSGSMLFLLRDRETRLSMGVTAALRAKDNFDVSKMVQEYEQLYEHSIDHSHRLGTETVLRQRGMSLREV